MKKHLLHLLILMTLTCTFTLKAQVVVIDNFDNAIKDSLYQNNKENGSTMSQEISTTDKHGGTAALLFKATVANLHSWGSYAQLIRTRKSGAPFFNFQGSDSLSLWLKVVKPPKNPGQVVFRIHLGERQDTAGNMEEYIYENATILDSSRGWVNLKVPLREIDSKDRTVNPGDSGFVIVPSSWNPPPINDGKLDLTHLAQYNISFITSGAISDSIEVLYDDFERTGSQKIPFVVFNGKVVAGDMTLGTWGDGGSITVVPGAGSAPGKAALKWVSGFSWGGWGGWYADFAPKNLGGNWAANDTMKLKVKVPATFNDDLRVQFSSLTNVPNAKEENGKKVGKAKFIFKKADYNWDGTWKTLSCPIRGTWQVDNGFIGFDSTQVIKFEVVGETGKLTLNDVYFDDIWMGNPVFDVIAPGPVTNLKSTAGQYSNLITWKDVPNEPNSKYDVYYSPKPITDLKAKEIEVVKLGVVPTEEKITHTLRAPNTDQDVTFYYAVTCTDAAGNVGTIASTGAVTTKAKGVPTISTKVPATFNADGNLSEFTTAGIKPLVIKLSDGTGALAENSKVDNDDDLSVLCYLAVDNTNLYVAFDVKDDVVAADTNANKDTWLRDCPDLFIGLYDFHGAYHTSYARGATPDYHFRFNQDRAWLDGQASDRLVEPGPNYIFKEKLSGGYAIEAKIPLQDIATKRNSGFSGTLDQVFVPAEGMRIPIDFSINDNDGTGTREGILCYSPNNNDKSWGDVSRWLYTWIGNKMYTGVEQVEGPVNNYSLSQNFPNPFNPTTTIRYSVAKPGMVTLKVYDVVGREVANLVQQDQSAGTYQVNFDASMLSSGIYFYRLQAGEFVATNKMMLIK